jgi:hypothetical protein
MVAVEWRLLSTILKCSWKHRSPCPSQSKASNCMDRCEWISQVIGEKGQHLEGPVSCWRSVFIANEFAELGARRRTKPALSLVCLVCFVCIVDRLALCINN